MLRRRDRPHRRARPTRRCSTRSPTTRRPSRPARPAERGGRRASSCARGSAPSRPSPPPATRPPAATRCWCASCLRALEADGVGPDAAHADVVRDDRPARGVARGRCCGWRRLPTSRRAVARAVAVLGEGAELPAVAALAGIDERRAPPRPRALARAEILRPEAPLGFVHPLVRDAVYREIPPGERELQHMQAARVLRRAAPSPSRSPPTCWRLAARRASGRRPAAEAGSAALRRGAPDERGRLPAARARGAAARRPARRGAARAGRAEALSSAPGAVEHLREAYARCRIPACASPPRTCSGAGAAFAARWPRASIATRTAIGDLPPELDEKRSSSRRSRSSLCAFGADADMGELRRGPVAGYRAGWSWSGVGDRMLALSSRRSTRSTSTIRRDAPRTSPRARSPAGS